MSNFPAASPANSCANGVCTYSGVAPTSFISSSVISTMYPDGFFVFGSMNCSGGKVRSTPSFAFLVLVLLSRIELAVALRPAPAALPAKAPAPDAPITARPPALISAPRVVRPFETAFVSSSDIVSSGVRAMTLSFADVRTTRKDLQCAQLLSVGAMIRSVRTTAPGLRPRDAAATIVFEGRPIGCRPGDTVAAALLDAG